MTRRPRQIETERGPIPKLTDLEMLLLDVLVSFGPEGTYMSDWANKCEKDSSAFFRAVARLQRMGLVENTGIEDMSPRSNRRVYRRVNASGSFALTVNNSLVESGHTVPVAIPGQVS